MHNEKRDACLSIDGTFNVSKSKDLSGIVLSTFDSNRHFYLIAVAICDGEKSKYVKKIQNEC
jgi:hypothetical protein